MLLNIDNNHNNSIENLKSKSKLPTTTTSSSSPIINHFNLSKKNYSISNNININNDNFLDQSLLKQLSISTQIIDEKLNHQLILNQSIPLDYSLQGHSSSDYSISPNLYWSPLLKRRSIHLPDVLFDQYDVKEHRCLMGIFPEIHRAWFTVDNRLFLWDYDDGNEFASFDQLQEIISSIAIAKPKPGLFVNDIQHLLIITTPLNVTIVGLALKPTSQNNSNIELSLYLTGLSVPTDGIIFTSIFPHNSTGRIFLIGSSDSQSGQSVGNELFEFDYHSDEGWFKKRCSLINHSRGGKAVGTLTSLLPSWLNPVTRGNILLMTIDQDRNLIYILIKTGSIIMLSLGKSAKEVPIEVASVTNIVREALAMFPSAGPLLDPRTFEITGMHIINKQEGGKVGLVAITSQGVRLYFSHARRGYNYGYNPSTTNENQDSTPNSLWLYHVRLPPRNPPTSNQNNNQLSNLKLFQLINHQNELDGDGSNDEIVQIPSNLNLSCSHYTSPGGFWLATHSLDSEHNILLAIAPEVTQHTQTSFPTTQFTSNSLLSLQPSHQKLQQQQQLSQPTISEIACPIMIEGHAWAITNTTCQNKSYNNLVGIGSSNQEWLVLSNMGITVLSSQRPVDTLAALLDSMPGKEQDLAIFWDRFGRDQTCAMSISIAVGDSSLIRSESANPKNYSLVQAIGHTWGPDAIAQAKKILLESSGRPEFLSTSDPQSYSNSMGFDEGKKIIFSGKHEGIALYMAWLLRPIWKEKVIILSGPTSNISNLNLTEKILTNVQKELDSLRNFMDNEMILLTSLPDVRTVGRTDPNLYHLEQASIVGLRLLLTQAIEALSFINLLMDYQLSDLMSGCPQEVCETLLSLTYREFITEKRGRDCARELVKTLINQQINQSFSVDAISETLQQRCGSFCTSDDVLLYKAIEALNKAKESQGIHEKRNLALEALGLFQKCAKHMSIEVLKDACTQFIEIAFLDGVVELSLTCAKVWDSGKQALSYWKESQPTGDSRKALYDLLDQCYDCIRNALVNVNQDVFNSNGLTAEEASAVLDHAIELALANDDELFHYRYYDWLLDQNKTMPLLETQTPYLETYLKAPPITLSKADLLWQYYTRNSAFFEAARILANLADDDRLNLNLPRRIEYLSLAVSNAKSSPHLKRGDDDGEAFAFLTDIEEKLEVAQVQVEILQNVVDLSDEEFEGLNEKKETVITNLQSSLFTISQLYRDVVEPLGLLESTLLIFHVSDHQDFNFTQSVWLAIIERAHEGRLGGMRGVEAVASKITELGRKFYPSDISFNMPMIVGILEKYAYDHPLPDRKQWVGRILREAGVPWQVIWEAVDELFTSRSPPWHMDNSISYLALELAGILEQWVGEVNELSDLSLSGVTGFPAARLEDVIDRYVDALNSNNQQSNKSSINDINHEELNKIIRMLHILKIKIREVF